ncbi:MAG TPA: hypothetical protein PLY31_03095 [Tenuifilaceae bacterium]|jgi:hypothetical protein|nr:hypothetical protein [Tenuifilaceae bacterium]
MKLKLSLLGALIFATYDLFAQDSLMVQKNHSISMEVAGLTYNYETPVANKITLIGRLGLQAGVGYSSSFGSYYAISPAVSLEPRFYYNISKRKSIGKNILGNSANFLSINTMYVLDPVIEHKTTSSDFFVVNPQWGIRRVYWNHFLLEAGAGFSYFFNTHGDNDFGLMLNLRLGYSF